MITLYPAIDLKGGACVRLRRGDMASATTYSRDPAAQARAWREQGARWLHVVDLDGAFAGASRNGDAILAILAEARVPVQLGGGLRDRTGIARWLDAGMRRVILGSAALKDPALVREACRAHPGQIVVGIDARDGRVAAEGWAELSEIGAIDLARRFEDCGVAAIVYTDIGRDGMLAGVNLEATCELARAVAIPVIASGGVAGLADVAAVRNAPAPVEGVILGRALYDGRLSLPEALAAAC